MLFDPPITSTEAVRRVQQIAGVGVVVDELLLSAFRAVLLENERLGRIVGAARECRAAQVVYFKDRSNLGECKQLERRLDKLIGDGS